MNAMIYERNENGNRELGTQFWLSPWIRGSHPVNLGSSLWSKGQEFVAKDEERLGQEVLDMRIAPSTTDGG